MSRTENLVKTPLIGMFLVLVAMAIGAVIAYYDVGWYAIFGYAAAAIVAIVGFRLAFREAS